MRLFKLTHYPRLDRAHLDPARMLYSIVSSVQRRAPASLLVPRRACRGVAQPGRAPGSGPGGRRFKSSLPDQVFSRFFRCLSSYCYLDFFGTFRVHSVQLRITRTQKHILRPRPAECSVLFDLVVEVAHVSVFRAREELLLENIPLRQQLLTLHAQRPRPRLSSLDRLCWIVLGRAWSGWRRSLILVTPESVVRWHRAGGNRLDESLTQPKRGPFGFCRERALASRGF